MKAVLDELKEFTSSYLKSDFLQKNRELFNKKEGQLDQKEKLVFLEYLIKSGSDVVFLIFCEEAKMFFDLEQAKTFSKLLCEATKSSVFYRAIQIRNKNFFFKMAELIPNDCTNQYYYYATMLAIEYDCICGLQELLLKDKNIHFIYEDINGIEQLIQSQPDLRIGENIRKYFQNGTIGEDWQTYVENSKYIPDIQIDYFATKGLEICKENLKSYKKSRLLSDKTTLEELNDFIDHQYNWDDGVEIPYFIMHHKNCDLALRKKLFELGAGDCIDENTYKNVDKDPWKRFILELDDMIKKEDDGPGKTKCSLT